MQTELLKSLLSHDFFIDNRNYIKPSIFDDAYLKVWESIEAAQEKYQHDLSISDVSCLWLADNSTSTNAEYGILSDALEEVGRAHVLSKDVAKDVIEKLWRQESFRDIAQMSLDASSGSLDISTKIYEAIEKLKEGILIEDDLPDPITDDIHELLATATDAARWKFNIESLSRVSYGLGPSEFGIAFARPETGKSSFAVSLAAGPDGWCQQGAKVVYIGNEEDMKRTKLRAIQCWSGMTARDVEADPDAAMGRFAAIKDRFICVNAQEWTLDTVDKFIRKYAPDVVIIDQLDKVNIHGTYNSSHEKLRELYRSAREMAKRHEIALLAVSQASADAEGRTRLDFSMMENSRTGKAAEADWICGIGKHSTGDDAEPDGTRFLNICKNKLSGWHGVVACELTETGEYKV